MVFSRPPMFFSGNSEREILEKMHAKLTDLLLEVADAGETEALLLRVHTTEAMIADLTNMLLRGLDEAILS